MNTNNVVLVHGAWADGSSWSDVIIRLQRDGFNVMAPQFTLTPLADNVARLRGILADQPGPAIVVGHSYGGQIVTALGPDAPNVAGLVYIAGFALDEGESIGELLAQGPAAPAITRLRVDSHGIGWIPREDYLNYFAPDVPPMRANVMYAIQQPLHTDALADVMGKPAWKTSPSWYMVAKNDQVIPPDAERMFAKRMKATVVEVNSSHVAMISHPDEVYKLIVSAARPARMTGSGARAPAIPAPAPMM